MRFPTTALSAKSVLTWLALALASVGLVTLLTLGSVPAALLIGPMVASIVFGVGGATVRVPRPIFLAAQGVVGCLIAVSITGEIVAEVARDWPAMLLGAAITVGASALVGLFLARFGSLPGSTAAWGASPGAASAMVLMAQEYGADPRLVATMQYVRVITVVICASVVSRFLIEGAPSPLAPAPVTVAAGFIGPLVCLLLVAASVWLNEHVKIPAGGLMVPLFLAALLNATGAVAFAVPHWLVALAYTVIGWTIGLQFERGALVRSIRALPEMVGSAFATIALCAAGGWALMHLFGTTALTAYLATTPGGIDIVAIIALSGGADTLFVMALHVVRLLAVILLGPPIARIVARYARQD